MNTFLWGSLRGTDIATRICNVTEIICCDKVFPITGQILLTPVQLLRGYAKARCCLLIWTSSAFPPVARISRTVQIKGVFPEPNDIFTTFFGDNYILTDRNLTRTLSP